LCSSSVRAKAWPPVPSATKKMNSVASGRVTARSASRPGEAMGPGAGRAVAVGVKGVSRVEVGAGPERPVQPGAVGGGVGHRGVDCIGIPAPEAVDVDPRDARALLPHARSPPPRWRPEHQRLARGGARRAAARSRHDLLQRRPHRGLRARTMARGPRRTGTRRCRAAARPPRSRTRRSALARSTARRSAASGPRGSSGAAARGGPREDRRPRQAAPGGKRTRRRGRPSPR
jgi:hypothetical protein